MAKSITKIDSVAPAPEAVQAQAVGEILGAIANNKEPLLQFLDILNELHKAGLLDILQGLLKNRQAVGVIGITQLNKPGAQHIIKNGMSALELISGIDPAKLQKLLNGVVSGLETAEGSVSGPERPIGLLEMLKTMRDTDVSTSLRFMIHFMRGMGAGLSKTTH